MANVLSGGTPSDDIKRRLLEASTSEGRDALTTKNDAQARDLPSVEKGSLTQADGPNREQAKDALAVRNDTRTTAQGQTPAAVKQRKFKNLPNVNDGYYVVANVYKGGQYLDAFIDQLSTQGIDANYIDNPNNGLKYVYLERYDTWEAAEAAAASKLNGAYEGATWVMNVDNRYTNEAYAANVDKINQRTEDSDYDTEPCAPMSL